MTQTVSPAVADKSVLRQLRRSGDRARDGRGRVQTMPPILHYGFRPFFFLAALFAGLAIPAWLWMYFAGNALPGAFTGLNWHAHEMLFGYVQAVLAGFVLTAIPNWTGRLPLSGLPLALLVTLWLTGRIACAFVAEPHLAMALDITFPAALCFAVWREVIAGNNWKNAPVAVMLTLFGLANAIDHAGNLGLVADGIGTRLALGAILMLLALIGGRIVPSFTRNWLAKTGPTALPASFGLIDKVALGATLLAAAAWVAIPQSIIGAVLLLVAGLLLGARLVRWQGGRTLREPMLLVLHIGYGWLSLALLLLGASGLFSAVPESAALHALTAGAIGTMTLAVMTRASLGHTGREIVADRATTLAYMALTLGAMLRVAAPFFGDWYREVLIGGGAFWSGAFLLFAIRYTPILWSRRVGT